MQGEIDFTANMEQARSDVKARQWDEGIQAFNPEMLQLALDVRGLEPDETDKELLAGRKPTREEFQRLAVDLEFPESFFMCDWKITRPVHMCKIDRHLYPKETPDD